MKTDFDFDRIGKREPYEVPDNFFQCLEKNIMKEVATPRKHTLSSWRIILPGAASAAAVIAVLFTIGIPFGRHTQDIPATPQYTQNYAMEDVEQVFAKLSDADQNYLLETYQDDIFINPQ